MRHPISRHTVATLILALVFASFPRAGDAAPGSWYSTGPMVVGRWLFTLTALEHGKALATGGFAPGTTTATAELYDPVTRSWSPTGSMAVARAAHTATRLLDGRVLIVGGASPFPTWTNTAEIYDPVAGTFTATGSMAYARAGHTATLLLDGRVLVTGGDQSTAEIYDPSTGTFTTTAPMRFGPRSTHVGILLPSGRVLIAGGSVSPTTELYDPSTGTWSASGDLNVNRGSFGAVLLPDSAGDPRVPAGKVLVAGGGVIPGGAETASAELYDPATGVWSVTVPMHVARKYFEMTVSNGLLGYVAAAGGTSDNLTTSLDSYELYYGDSWAVGGPLHQARDSHRMVTLTDGYGPLVAGGYDHTLGAPAQTSEVQIPPAPADTTPPSITPTIAGTLGLAGYYNSDVTVSWNVSDAESTITGQSGCTSTTLSTDTTGVTLTCTATSAGGTSSQNVTVKRDATPPVLTVPAPITVDATSASGATVLFAVNATDGIDATPSLSCNAASGALFAIGTTNVQCSATDDAGNTTNGAFVITVRGAADQLATLVTSVMNATTKPASYAGQLTSVLDSLAAGSTADACGTLDAFANHVRAQTGKQLSASEAQTLLDAAARIAATIGCP